MDQFLLYSEFFSVCLIKIITFEEHEPLPMPLLYIPTQILMSAQRVTIKKSSVDPMESVIILLGVIGATAQMDTPITAWKGHHAQVSVQCFCYFL